MDINIVIDAINSTSENASNTQDETRLEVAKNQILGIVRPQIQITTIDKIDLPKDSEPREKAMATYKKALKEKRDVEFNRRLRAQEFRNNIRNNVGSIKIDNTLSNRPNKRR